MVIPQAQLNFNIPPQVVEKLRLARYVAVLTGAGISAESGLPTFRDKLTGLWAKYNPQDLSSPEAFERSPRLVWDWFAWRRELISQVKPNPGHLALVEIERHAPRFTLLTQNVDGLHQQAGSHNVIELHGNINRFKCYQEDTPVKDWSPTEEVPPRCPRCGGLIRPDVVWFDELLPEQALQAGIEAAEKCDVFLSIGTSGTVEPAASLPRLAKRRGATVVIINPAGKPLYSPGLYRLCGPAGQILPELVRRAWK